MKNWFTVIFCFVFCFVNAKQCIISGKIYNTKNSDATISYYENFIDYKEVIISIHLDIKGMFKTAFLLGRSTYLKFKCGEESTRLFLQPEDSIYLTLDTKQFDESIHYSGKGSGNCNYMAKKFLDFENSLGSKTFQVAYQTRMAYNNATEFALLADSVQSIFVNHLAQNKAGLSDAFLRYENAAITYKFAHDKMIYTSLHAFYNKSKKYDLQENSYYNFLDSLEINNDNYLISSEYVSFLNDYLWYKYQLLTTHSKDKATNAKLYTAKLSELIFTGNILELIKAKICYDGFSHDKFNNIEPLYMEFKKIYPQSAYLSVLESKYNKAKSTSIGQPAPDFILSDLNGKKIALSDFKGKVVYMDIWASWCQPCLREIPAAKKLKEHFAGKDIVFLYVSIDADTNAWKNSIEKNHIEGVHLLSPDFKGELGQLYGVNGVPTYFLIDKKGLIVDNAPPRPSDDNIIAEIQTELEK